MKKFIINIIIFICIIFCNTVTAETMSDGYIVKVKNTGASLMSVDDELSYIGENLYRADDINAIYDCVAQENIEVIFPDYICELFDTDYPVTTSDIYIDRQWYLGKIGAVSIREKGLSGKGVKIAVIDSGVNTSHYDFNQANILQGYNCIPGEKNVNDCSDNVGHGTMVAGIIAAQTDNGLGISGIASNAQIIPIKITDQVTLNISNIFSGLKKAIETDCDIINMSLGATGLDKDAMAVFKELIDKAEKKGKIVIAAAGNTGHINNAVNYPAGFDNVIGVGAVNEDLTVSEFSQKNKGVFVTAPGKNIISLYEKGSIASNDGTSFSAPMVTAVTAIIKEVCPNYSIQDIKNLLVKTSTDAGSEGYDVSFGYGILNASKIIEELNENIPDIIISQGILNSKRRIHIHNNLENSVVANAYFTLYDDTYNREIIEKSDDINLLCGVTNITLKKDYDEFFLWDKKLRPYIKNYSIEK